VLGTGRDPVDVAWWGALIGVPAFAAIIAAGPMGAGAVRGGHAGSPARRRAVRARHADGDDAQRAARTDRASRSGAWGAVQATAAGLAVALGGIIRDLVTAMPGATTFRPEAPYTPVFNREGGS
jgi:BCD family chlorophyll transporter-like MFS transporter